MKAQLTELLTNYGEIGGIWFDGEWDQMAWDGKRFGKWEYYIGGKKVSKKEKKEVVHEKVIMKILRLKR